MTPRERLKGLLARAASDGYSLDTRIETEELADYLLAEGVIVPPCKVGDVVWVNWQRYAKAQKETHPVKVYALRFDTKKNNMRICVEGNFEIVGYGGSYTHYYNGTFALNSIGKTVFLTRAEAERALEGG